MTKLTHFNEWKDLELYNIDLEDLELYNIVFAKSNLQHFFKQAHACWYTGRYATGLTLSLPNEAKAKFRVSLQISFRKILKNK